ncbi:MAG: hypothetical protein ACXQT4_05200 [Methanotrichaceae archaeon]
MDRGIVGSGGPDFKPVEIPAGNLRSRKPNAFKRLGGRHINPATGMSPNISGGKDTALGHSSTPKQTFTQADVAGVWSLTLRDSSARSVDLTLYQHSGEVFGHGTMTTGTVNQDITAAGSVTGNTLNLCLVTVEGTSMYRFNLAVNNRAVSGTYNAYSFEGASWDGSCNGNKYTDSAMTTMSSGASQPIVIGNIHRYNGQISAR